MSKKEENPSKARRDSRPATTVFSSNAPAASQFSSPPFSTSSVARRGPQRLYSVSQLRAFQVVISLAALWWLLLLIGALLTSNPPMLEAQLVAEADAVVQVRLQSEVAESLVVENCWSNPLRDGCTLCTTLRTLPRDSLPPESQIVPQVSYLLPLKNSHRSFQVLQSSLSSKSRLVPATPITLRELNTALEVLKKVPNREAPLN